MCMKQGLIQQASSGSTIIRMSGAIERVRRGVVTSRSGGGAGDKNVLKSVDGPSAGLVLREAEWGLASRGEGGEYVHLLQVRADLCVLRAEEGEGEGEEAGGLHDGEGVGGGEDAGEVHHGRHVPVTPLPESEVDGCVLEMAEGIVLEHRQPAVRLELLPVELLRRVVGAEVGREVAVVEGARSKRRGGVSLAGDSGEGQGGGVEGNTERARPRDRHLRPTLIAS